jgi:BASS family bile acid:Na+ symporter
MIIFRFISQYMAVWTLIGAALAFFQPQLFIIFKPVFQWLFAATMFALGVVLLPEELRTTLREPRQIGLGLLTQYSVMPLLGFAAAWLSGLPAPLALGLIVVGCAPGAMASNVIVYLAGGAVAYSVALTMVATMLSPLATPLLVQWLGGAYMDIPFYPMMLTILKIVVIPLFLGILLRRRLGRYLSLAQDIAPAIAALSIIIICSYAVAANQARLDSVFHSSAGGLLISMVIGINLIGYLLGAWLARAYGFDRRHRVALSIEIGMQNAGLGVVLALRHFSPETALPAALFAVWCVLTAAVATLWLRYREQKMYANSLT